MSYCHSYTSENVDINGLAEVVKLADYNSEPYGTPIEDSCLQWSPLKCTINHLGRADTVSKSLPKHKLSTK